MENRSGSRIRGNDGGTRNMWGDALAGTRLPPHYSPLTAKDEGCLSTRAIAGFLFVMLVKMGEHPDI